VEDRRKKRGKAVGMLEHLRGPHDLKRLTAPELATLAQEIRDELMRVIPRNGGHYGPNLGAVELTLALHRAFDSPRDRLFWDVGHQCYPHKLVTGRFHQFETLRQEGGLFGYPSPAESEHDPVFAAHAGHSISLATGVALANAVLGQEGEAVAIIGDGAMTAGMAYEALDHLGGTGKRVIIVLNDNGMSICTNVGALPAHLRQFVPAGSGPTSPFLWEAFGIRYLGPVDGHDVAAMEAAFAEAQRTSGPVMVHVCTIKGKGDPRAEADAAAWHDMAPAPTADKKPGAASWSSFAADAIVRAAERDPRVVAITAAMAKGTGLTKFRSRFPERFFDVGIAEQHAVALAAGLARQGARPVVGIYSTFLQRAYDQFIHDVCIQDLPVVFALDRAGIVGDDGKTQQGVFDYSYMRCIPNIVLMAPKDENELQHMLHTALQHDGPVAVRYPRGAAIGVPLDATPQRLPVGKAEVLRRGADVALLGIGLGVDSALHAAEQLAGEGVSATVVNARFVKPLDRDLILDLAHSVGRLVTIEENALAGGFGSAVWELLEHEGVEGCRLYRVGVPDEFVEHGSQASWRKRYGLDAAGVLEAVRRHYPELFRQKASGARREGSPDRPAARRRPETEPVGAR
jgi:1-deoxy-D-xylulose-5-phosphate synthase